MKQNLVSSGFLTTTVQLSVLIVYHIIVILSVFHACLLILRPYHVVSRRFCNEREVFLNSYSQSWSDVVIPECSYYDTTGSDDEMLMMLIVVL